MVLSAIDWDTHSAWLLVPDSGVPLDKVAFGLGDALASWVGVGGIGMVTVGLGIGVVEGVRDRSWDTCANTVAATSVRKGFKSRVGVLVGAEELQADNQSRLRNTPITSVVFIVCTI
jgi:hypothetical protein